MEADIDKLQYEDVECCLYSLFETSIRIFMFRQCRFNICALLGCVCWNKLCLLLLLSLANIYSLGYMLAVSSLIWNHFCHTTITCIGETRN
uniref:Uncharacterized protein n=1 Tax=Populus davidiana TaxID=266767 RepID=A0A6M2F183_9ROSI